MSNAGMSKETMTAKRKRMTPGVALASLVLLVSCNQSHVCTMIGCSYPLTLQLEAADWVPGEYVVAITASGRTYECSFERGADGVGGQAGSPTQPSGIVQYCDPVPGDATEPGDAPEIYGDEDVTIEVKRDFKQVSVSVRRDGVTLLEEELTPSYQKSYPNGPDCTECRKATEKLTLPAEGS